MKNQEEHRFPASLELFKFCFYVLQKRRPEGKNNDQEIGDMIGLTPSDTSHWKSGKKQIKNLYMLETLSKSLEVDRLILENLALGITTLEDAIFEFQFVEAEKAFALEAPELQKERHKRAQALESLCYEIRHKAQILTAPVFIPEILMGFSNVKLVPYDDLEGLAKIIKLKPGQYAIRYTKLKNQAVVRFALAQELAKIFILYERERYKLPVRIEALTRFELHDFAFSLLLPRSLLLSELTSERFDEKRPLEFCSQAFWLSHIFVRTRLNDLLLRTSQEEEARQDLTSPFFESPILEESDLSEKRH
jgi:hypothetical protein